jgi:dTMP kinase
MTRGKFITLEGIEGAGKSTHLPYIAELIAGAGKDVITTREPGGTPTAERIRDVLLGEGPGSGMPEVAELLLMFAARAVHLREKILPALESGTWVVCDRFTDASFAYQAAGRGIPHAQVALLEGIVQGDFRPDLVLVFDLPVAEGLKRAHARGKTNRFEAENAPFFERVRRSYLERAGTMPSRYAIVDANQAIDVVRAQVRGTVQRLLKAE